MIARNKPTVRTSLLFLPQGRARIATGFYIWLLAFLSAQAAADSGVLSLNFQLPASEISRLEADKSSNETVDAVLSTGASTNLPVRLRHRGRWSRSWEKTPLKVFFSTNRLENRSCLNLNSPYRDPSWMRERLAFYLFEKAGVPASRTRFAEVSFNSKFRGVYIEVEQVDANFTRTRGLAGAEVYKATGLNRAGDERRLPNETAYSQAYEKQTKSKSGYKSLMDFCNALQSTTNPDNFFEENVDVDRYISYLAISILIQHWDGFNKNHVLLHDADKTGKWLVVPWDVDRTFGDWPHSTMRGAFNMTELPIELGIESAPGITGWNRLQNRFWQSKKLRERLARRLDELLTSEFSREKLFPLIDGWAAELQARVKADRSRWGSASELDFPEGIQELKSFIEKRSAFVKSALPGLRR